MRLLPLLVLLAPVSALAAHETAPPAAKTASPDAKPCTPKTHVAVTRGELATMHPLSEEPPAAEVKALYRTKDGCLDPLVTRTGIGLRNGKQAAIARTPAGPRDARD